MTRSARLLPLLCFLVALPASAEVFDSVFGGLIPCTEQDGVQFCEGSIGQRVESFDGVPIDLNLTLPPSDQTGPFPLIFSMHGWGGGKDNDPQTDFALDGSTCECRLIFIESLSRGSSREQPEDIRVLLTSLRLAIRLRWEVIERFHTRLETLHAENPKAAIGAELKERLEVIQQESESLGLLDREKLVKVFPEHERQKVEEMYDEWEELGATLFDAEKIVDQDGRYSDMEVALGRLAKLNETYLRMATKLFSEKSS